MKTKMFDCVEMKQKAAQRIVEETRHMSLEERIAYWKQKSDLFLQKHRERLQKNNKL